MGKRIGFAATIFLVAMTAFGVETDATKTAEELAQLLAGPGITITNATIIGSPNSIGSFTGGNADGFTMNSGVILSSGNISTAKGPNTAEGTSGSTGGLGDAGLDALIAPFKSRDAIILEFDAVTTTSTFSIRYIFASEEYKEYVGSQYNDVFAFFVDGANIALVPGGTEPVAINTINHQKNTGLYNDNPANSGNFQTSFDGFTTELVALATVAAGTTHRIRLALADASDTILDSAVFLAAGGISGAGVAGAVIPQYTEVVVGPNETNTMDVTVYGVPVGKTPTMSASGLPPGATVTFTPKGTAGFNTPVYAMSINVGANVMPGVYPLIIASTIDGVDTLAHVNVVIDCAPPMILSLPANEPQSVTVDSGATATLRVVASGSNAFKYQWYMGHPGSTVFPIAGATSATLTTPRILTPTEFWVRVSNPCGSVDSNGAIVTPR